MAITLLLAIAPLPPMSVEACASIVCCCAEPTPQQASCCSAEPAPAPPPCTCQLAPHDSADKPIVFTASPPSRDKAPTALQPDLAPVTAIAAPSATSFSLVAHSHARLHIGLSPPFEAPLFLCLSVFRR